MKHLLYSITAIVLSVLVLNGCRKGGKQSSTTQADTAKVNTIIVGVLPTLDCLPFYVANMYDICRPLGLNIKLVYQSSQMDLEQSLINEKIDIAASDIFRVMMMQNKRYNIRFLATSSREWQLYANKKRRITKIDHLGDRMVGMTRCSVLDYYCDTITTRIKKNSGLLLRPQINDVFIRMQMLNEAQFDAAFIPLPLNQIADAKEHTSLGLLQDCDGFTGFAVNCNRIKSKSSHIPILIKAYNMAVDSIKLHPDMKFPAEIIARYKVDSIPYKLIKGKSLSHIYHPSGKKITSALQWVKKNKFAASSYKADTLTYVYK